MNSPSLSWLGKIGLFALFVSMIGLSLLTLHITSDFGISFRLFVVVLFLSLSGAILGMIHSPFGDRIGENIRFMNGSQQAVYKKMFSEFGIALQGILIADKLHNSYGFAEVYGLIPTSRYLFIDGKFFKLYNPMEQKAVLARECELTKNCYPLILNTIPFQPFIIYVMVIITKERFNSIIFLDYPHSPIILTILITIIIIVYLRYRIYLADEFAANQTTRYTVIRALAKFEREMRKTSEGQAEVEILSKFWTRPSPRKRIEHLRR